MTFFAGQAFSQWYDPDKVDKKAAAIYENAYGEAKEGKFEEAIRHINEAITIDPRYVDAYLSRAGISADRKNYSGSIHDFETAILLDSVYCSYYLLPYSISLAGNGQFAKAMESVNLFLSNPKLNEQSRKAGIYRRSCYLFALDYEKNHPAGDYVFTPKNLGDSINTVNLEYFPSLTIDGKKMVFTRRINNDEDFYESNRVNGQWSMAHPLDGKVNTNLNEGAQNISQDGQWIIFTGCNYPEGEGSCDLYISYKTKNGWSEAQNLGPMINTEAWESSPSLSPDKRDLYFASSRPGGFGGRDIWVSHRLPNGKWGRPENLGDAVNTPGDESCPFMHADNETLFFNSNGQPGYGATDLFFSKKVSDSTWTVAENLGYPINTIDDEGSLVVDADGETAYFASERSDTRGGLDLYSFTLRKDIRPAITRWIRGKVFDKKTKAGLPSQVELTEIHTGKLINRLQTDEEGNYLITLPVGKIYAFNVNRKGYLFYSENINLANKSGDSTFTVDIPLQPLEKDAVLVLKNIFFDTKQFALKTESIVELDNLVFLLRENPALVIQLSGHTDNVGMAKDNITLSNNRAKTVVAYLVKKGIAPARLTSIGYGATKPIADNSNETGRALNRRTELLVIHN